MASDDKDHNLSWLVGVLALELIFMTAWTSAAEADLSTATNTAEPKVTRVYGEIAAGKTIRVVVTNLLEWSRLNKENDPTKLLPYLNGRQLTGLFPSETYLRTGRLAFYLAITDVNKDAWTDLLRKPTSFKRDVSFTVGLEGKERFDTVYRFGNKDLKLTIMSGPWAVVSLTVVVLTGIILVRLARSTDLIRDPATGPISRERCRPYNLGRTQMAFWFFLILTSYVVLWLITGSLETISPSILALMGISAGTALGDTLIDVNKHESESARRRSLLAEKKTIPIRLAELEPQPAGLGATPAATSAGPGPAAPPLTDSEKKERMELRKRLEEIDPLLKELEPSQNEQASQGFLHDLLTDGQGYSFHRFQIFAWTIVLGIIFISSVYEGLVMPEFNSTLLGLMGLSAGTYVSLKFPEK